MGKVTMVDVARFAGVSVPTVSRVLNGNTNVNSGLRQKVEHAITAMRYTPNLSARSTRTGANNAISIILPSFETNLLTSLLQGAADTCMEKGYSLSVYQSNGNIEKEIKCIDAARQTSPGGILYCPVSIESVEYFEKTRDRELPVVIVSRRGLIDGVPHVYYDDRTGCYTATKYLLRQGRRHIAFFAGFWEAPGHDAECLLKLLQSYHHGVYSSIDRLRGYADALKEFGLDVRKSLLYITAYNYASGYESMNAFLASLTEFDAVICSNDRLAAGILQSLHEQNISVPAQVSLIGFDDGVICNITRPTLTSLRQPSYRMGQKAAETLIGLLNGAGAEDVKLDMELVIRNSTAAKNSRFRRRSIPVTPLKPMG
jgi:LacI family transcriptional regulator